LHRVIGGGPRLAAGFIPASERRVRHMARSRAVCRLSIVLLGAAPLACTATHYGLSYSDVAQPGMSCSEAARVASATLLRLGFSPELVDAPQPGAPGKVVGHKNSGWSAGTPEPGTEYTATVTVKCSNQGAEFEAETDEPIPASLTFKTDFRSTIEKVASRRVTRPRLNDEPEAGLLIAVEPLRGGDVSGEFGSALNAAGITPVRVKIDNHTDRTYAFAAARVQLVTQEGERMDPLAAERTAQLSASLQSTLRQKQIPDGEILPKGTATGYLYFPASAYRRATLVLIDQATDEEEGFSVEF
jgi:hypothetical protein